MANCPPVQSGLVDFVYDKMPDGIAVAFDHYRWHDYQAAALRTEMYELTMVLDHRQPPWNRDKTRSPGVFRRRIPDFGTIWYTFALIDRRRRLVILTGTCESVDDRNAGVKSDRQEFAERRVEQLRIEGSLCQ